MSKPVAAVVLAAFSLYTTWVVLQTGYFGLWAEGLDNTADAQILIDLVITSVIMLGWLVPDARRRGVKAWPFVVLTVTTGSIGPLAYLLWRPSTAASTSHMAH